MNVNKIMDKPIDSDQLVVNVIEWADEKCLLKQFNSTTQMCKVMEEVGEVAKSLIEGDKEGLRDGIGDTLVTLTILAAQNGMTLNECFNAAWSEIKDRTGKTVNGTFIKDK